ncbi:MAG: hypothetical protein J6A19_02995, partial [Oscillospiraceae bacterium]|nr:hypothetical protein [Oscillospiraceae bacterium]
SASCVNKNLVYTAKQPSHSGTAEKNRMFCRARSRGKTLSMLYEIDFLTREKTLKTEAPQRAKMRVEALDWCR